MPIFIDEPIADSPVASSGFTVRGWLWLESQHENIAAVEVWAGETLAGEVAALHARADVNAALALPAGIPTGFTLTARPPASDAQPVVLSLRARLRDGTRTAELARFQVVPGAAARDPLGELWRRLPREARGLEIGAHQYAVPGVTPFYTDVVADFAGSTGRADFLADACALPLPAETLDYLCSSHVLEHLPDPLAALHEWHRVLRPGGWLYLVVPDKRFTFDSPRAVTPTSHLLRDFLRATTAFESTEHIDEFVYQTDWKRLCPDCQPEQQASRQAAIARHYRDCLREEKPIDIHFHTFTPDSLHATLELAGVIGGGVARFSVVARAERFPPDRGDGIALLLQKTGRRPPAPPAVKTFELAHHDRTIAPLPLACPVTLAPLHQAEGGTSLVSAAGHPRYAIAGRRPVLLPPRGSKPRRSWGTRFFRLKTYLAGRLRLARAAPAR